MAKLKGIRKHRGGWEVSWRGADGSRAYKRYPIDTPIDTMVTARKQALAKVVLTKPTVARGTYDDELARFLLTMRPGPRQNDFRLHLAKWTPYFTGRRLTAIDAEDVTAILKQWVEEGLSKQTAMRYRSSLMSMLNYAIGKHNVVRDSLAFKPPASRPRAVDLGVLATIFAAAPACQTKARLMMTFYFGVRPSEIMRLDPARDIKAGDADAQGQYGHVYIRSADQDVEEGEGKGTRDRILPILSQAQLAAVQLFLSTDARGSYSTAAARTSFLRWARAAGLSDSELIEGQSRNGRNRYRIRPYDLRHTFGTEMRRVAGVDLADVGAWMGHRNLKTTERYAPTQEAKVAAGAKRSAVHGSGV